MIANKPFGVAADGGAGMCRMYASYRSLIGGTEEFGEEARTAGGFVHVKNRIVLCYVCPAQGREQQRAVFEYVADAVDEIFWGDFAVKR